jgi:hypothetical protein
MSLVDLIRKRRSKSATLATVATVATVHEKNDLTVAAYQPLASVLINGPPQSRWWQVHFVDRESHEICCNPITDANTLLSAIAGAIRVEALANGSQDGLTEPDQYGHWSQAEVELTLLRTSAFVSRGVPFTEADIVACQLVDRDRTADDRRSCAECIAFVRGRCQRGLKPFGLRSVMELHRCDAFTTTSLFTSETIP